MKKARFTKIMILPALLIFSVSVYALNIISGFTAVSNNDVIDLHWSTSSEKNIEKFEIERSLASTNNFRKIHTEDAKGNPSGYDYTDKEAFKTAEKAPDLQTTNTYYYRLKVIYEDGSYDYSDAINVVHQTSSVRKTWGMIKEMMR